MKRDNSLQVYYNERLVGTLAMTAGRKIAFQYSKSWIEKGFSISPFSLPLKDQVFIPTKDYFQGLFGVFADSLPDGWGNLLLNRLLRSHKQNPDDLTVTSGGARPKIMTSIDGGQWIIKFPAHVDGENAGKMEYDYSCCARQCGIIMSETRLFPSEKCEGYFGTKRFDRAVDTRGEKKIHMLTAAALLELDFEQPSMDYHGLMKLTKILTNNNEMDLENMFRRMCFNVFAHNRDDHSKNFTFLYDEENDSWRLSPAYDLTYSNTYYGEHTTAVDGNGRNPGEKEILAVGIAAGMNKEKCLDIMKEIEASVKERLGEYL